ncbi:MAG: cupin domain-containing protein [Proteobacteria bacterium]|nr:cupin domain-containing protein [Pseudomonadota bacterium]
MSRHSPFHLSASEIDAIEPFRRQHQFNDNAVRLTRTLGERVGMQRIGIHLITVEPGFETTQHHYHDSDEEFIYVLEGEGEARIGDAVFTVTAGDFMGFPTPSPAHSMRNTSSANLVYLVGGENNPEEVVHYPDIKRTMIRAHGKRRYVDWEHLKDV